MLPVLRYFPVIINNTGVTLRINLTLCIKERPINISIYPPKRLILYISVYKILRKKLISRSRSNVRTDRRVSLIGVYRIFINNISMLMNNIRYKQNLITNPPCTRVGLYNASLPVVFNNRYPSTISSDFVLYFTVFVSFRYSCSHITQSCLKLRK